MIRISKVVEALERVRRDSATNDDAVLLAEYICALLLQLHSMAPDEHSRVAYAGALEVMRRFVGGGGR